MLGSVVCGYAAAGEWPAFNISAFNANNIQLCYADSDKLLAQLPRLQNLLNSVEQAKASRFYRLPDMQRYTAQHGLLKLLLGRYLQIPGYQPELRFNTNNKPYLRDNPCYFNISHSGAYMLFGFSPTEIGVDIEVVNRDFQFADIASNHFSAKEEAWINESPQPHQAFFTLWTRKEALLKAYGSGIDDHLPQIPALDGHGQLPPHFNAIAWQSFTFDIDADKIGSVTYPAGTSAPLSFTRLTKEGLDELLAFNAV